MGYLFSILLSLSSPEPMATWYWNCVTQHPNGKTYACDGSNKSVACGCAIKKCNWWNSKKGGCSDTCYCTLERR